MLSSSEVPVRYCTYIPIADAAAVGDAAAFETAVAFGASDAAVGIVAAISIPPSCVHSSQARPI